MGKMKEKLEDLVEKPVKSDTWNDEASDELEEIRAARDLERGCKVLGGASLGGLERWDRYLLAEWVRTRNRVRIDWLGARIGNFNRGSMSGSLFQLRKKLKEQRKLQAKWRLLSEN